MLRNAKLPEFQSKAEDLRKFMQDTPGEKWDKVLTEDYSWAWVNEFPLVLHLAVVVYALNLTEWITFRGEPWKWQVTYSAWHIALATVGIQDFRFHDLRHTWASVHRQAGTSCDELKELGGWKAREMVDRYAKYGTEHLAVTTTRIQRGRVESVGNIVTFLSRPERKKDLALRFSP